VHTITLKYCFAHYFDMILHHLFQSKTLPYSFLAVKISSKHVIYFLFGMLGEGGGPEDLIKIKQPHVAGFFFAYPLVHLGSLAGK